ncbi:MAG: hypothetical protein LBV49_02145 [Azonexus sp.]|nr:hypothetical protein [Azonexus sp.]
MNEHDLDPDLQDATLSALYRQLPPAEPDADLDAAIRAAARRAVGAASGSRNTAAAPTRWFATAAEALFAIIRAAASTRWLATAAVALLCVSVAVHMERQAPESLPEATRPAPATTPQAAPVEAAPAQAPVPLAEKSDKKKQVANAARAGTSANAEISGASAQDAPAKNFDRAETGNDRLMEPPPLPPPAPAPVAAAPAPVAAAKSAPSNDAITTQESATRATSETAAQRLDRDIARQQQNPAAPPDCVNHDNGDQQPLCDLLILRAANKPLPADWRQRLDAARLWQGDFAYRRVLLEKLFSR